VDKEEWLPGLGSNQGLQLQRLTCYRYTTGQCGGQGYKEEQASLSLYSDVLAPQRQGGKATLAVL
jgi:hypothetical protein